MVACVPWLVRQHLLTKLASALSPVNLQFRTAGQGTQRHPRKSPRAELGASVRHVTNAVTHQVTHPDTSSPEPNDTVMCWAWGHLLHQWASTV